MVVRVRSFILIRTPIQNSSFNQAPPYGGACMRSCRCDFAIFMIKSIDIERWRAMDKKDPFSTIFMILLVGIKVFVFLAILVGYYEFIVWAHNYANLQIWFLGSVAFALIIYLIVFRSPKRKA